MAGIFKSDWNRAVAARKLDCRFPAAIPGYDHGEELSLALFPQESADERAFLASHPGYRIFDLKAVPSLAFRMPANVTFRGDRAVVL